MAVTASMVKELREITGAGLMECKKALTETNGDITAAIQLMGADSAVSDDVRVVKYETFIGDINEAIKKKRPRVMSALSDLFRVAMPLSVSFEDANLTPTPLSMVFNPFELNEYGYVICKKAKIELEGDENNRYTDPWMAKYENSSLEDARTKIDAAKDFVRFCREANNRSEAYKFIFWSLMVLTVDKNNYDERLSLICDFARMLRITDDEMMDISYTIKCVYNEVEEEYSFKSDMVPSVLGALFNLYGNTDIDIY